jgi:RNA polymerase sigma factor (sigma-70 family)
MSDPRKQAIRRLAPAAIATLNLLASAPSLASHLPQDEVRTKLVREMQGGDRQAFDRLFRSEYGWSYKIASRTIPDREEAQDLVSAAWQKVWEESDRLRDPRSFRGWASAIITHMAYGQQRTRIRQKSVVETLPLCEWDEDLGFSPDRTARDPVGEEVLDRWTEEENQKALAEASARLETGLLDLGKDLSPARAEVYRVLLAHLSRESGSGLQTLRTRIADELQLSRNTASMRLLWLFRKAELQAVPLETIVADPELVRLTQPIFRRVAAQLGSPAAAPARARAGCA